MTPAPKDIVVLVADGHTESAMKSLLNRHEALGIRQLHYDVYVHPNSDPGCYRESQRFLRPLQSQYEYALVVFDLEGSGAERKGRTAVQHEVRSRIQRAGWEERTQVVVIDPELEVWVWSNSPEVDRCLGWSQRLPPLREWLRDQGFWDHDDPKPRRPKETLELALEEVGTPLSSSIFGDLAHSVSVNRCTDSSFGELRDILTGWFGS